MNKKTIRLEIRDFDAGAWRDLQAMHIDFENSEYCWYDAPQATEEQTVRAEAGKLAEAGHCYGVYLQGKPEMIGYVLFHIHGDIYDVGYEFRKSVQGHGYALEALSSTISELNRTEGVCRFTARTAEYNLPSIRLLERTGFIRTGGKAEQFRCDDDGIPVRFNSLVYILSLPEPA